MTAYNVDFVCTYQGSENNNAYRDDFLDLLGMEMYDDAIACEKITTIANDIQGCEELKALMEKSAGRYLTDDLVIGLMLLFSYSTMHLIHDCICDFYKHGAAGEEHVNAVKDALSS